ncbi:MAG: acyltransferase family protein [Xanthobacteraceae bacterium]
MESPSKSTRHVPELDGVRGIACIFIVLLHCLIGIATPPPGILQSVSNHAMPFLIGGVDLFFVLSAASSSTTRARAIISRRSGRAESPGYFPSTMR